VTSVESLVKAASDFLAAVLGKVGFVGRPRRRAAIHDDLKLLDQLRGSSDFGPDSPAHHFLRNHITAEVAGYSGVELGPKRKIPWGSVVLSILIGGPFGYWTYKLNDDGFAWFSILPGLIATLMFIAALGMIFGGEEASADEGETEPPGDEAVHGQSENGEQPHGSSEPSKREEATPGPGQSGKRVAAIDAHLADATPHPGGSTDEALQADQQRPY